MIANVEPFRQPKPAKNPGGDCFACTITAAIRHFFPDRPIDFADAWDAFLEKTADKDAVLSNTWWTMRTKVFWKLREQGYPLEYRVDFVYPTFDLEHFSACWWRPIPVEAWAYRLEAWLSAGWVALVEMNFDGRGPTNPDGSANLNDHFVILDGQRHFWKPHSGVKGAHSLAHETHVVCSAKGGYWIETKDLLERHGVAAIILMRPDKRVYREADANVEGLK